MFSSSPPKWAMESKFALAACKKHKGKNMAKEDHEDLKDKSALVGHGPDMVSITDERFKEECLKHMTEDEWKSCVAADAALPKGYFPAPSDEAVREVTGKGEADPHGMDQHAPGAKLDHGKVDIIRHFVAMFPNAMEAVALVSEYGERKYTYMGWAKVPDAKRRYTAAMGRHLTAETTDGVYDDGDSLLPHAAQLAWNAMARLEKMMEYGEVEARRGKEIK